MKKWLVFTSVFFVSPYASALPLTCENPIVLRKAVKECNQNIIYTNAAKKCVSDFENSVKVAKITLDQALERFSRSEKQAAGLSNAKQAYEKSVNALLTLSDRGKILAKQIAVYKSEVVLPEDFAAIGETGFSAKVFLDNNPCYKDSQDLLSTYEKLMDSLSEEVRLTAEISKKMQEKSLSGEQSLEITPPAPEAKMSSGGHKTPAPKGKSIRSSDISGTEPTAPGGKK